jgi:hypothetical protein
VTCPAVASRIVRVLPKKTSRGVDAGPSLGLWSEGDGLAGPFDISTPIEAHLRMLAFFAVFVMIASAWSPEPSLNGIGEPLSRFPTARPCRRASSVS